MAKENISKHEIIEAAIKGGLVGTALGFAVTKNSKDFLRAGRAGIVGAAIGASLQALKEAWEVRESIIFEENRKIYRLYKDGRKEFVKDLPVVNRELPDTFTIG